MAEPKKVKPVAVAVVPAELPVVVREAAEIGTAQAKEAYAKIKVATDEATEVFGEAFQVAQKGAAEFNLKAIEAARTNMNAALDFMRDMMAVKTLSEAVELSTAHARKSFETYTAQAKDLSGLAQKLVTEAAEPIKEQVTKSLKQAA
jgi:phasin